ncbi:hypothetical protein C2E20_6958 [Micractinium conductrix]|uniref:Glycosyltransferase 61 catalytic domain-containing protein n=1 Tax=Micractinium conductrix TaxID=554055 RepID=A0A2P6V5W8_9CHLO|nr:hypothetical protein C2E20_6958 [Micractinium conductrix]|eukprot:PSC69482.1 hypothetical protein C2E20_6958 [Micractinium conductrix]
MKTHTYAPVCGPAGSDSDEDRQSPHWSLSTYKRHANLDLLAVGGPAPAADDWQQAAAAAAAPPHPPQHACARFWAQTPRRWRQALCGGLLSVTLLCLLAALASGWGAGAPQPAARQQQCRLQHEGSPWEAHCQALRNVCLDQGQIILYDQLYQQLGGRKAGALPQLEVSTSKIYEYPWRASQAGDDDSADDDASSAADVVGSSSGSSSGRRLRYKLYEPLKNRRLEAPPLRPATSQEGTEYLQYPEFSTCTVPLLVFPSWRGNFFHTYKDLSALLYSLLRRTPWRQHAKLVVVTPEGIALTGAEAALLPPLSGLSVQSMADASARLAQGYRPELDAAQPRASYEGGQRRCFERMYVCGANFLAGRGLSAEEEAALSADQRTAAVARQVPVEPYAYGQAVALHMQQQRQQQARRQRQDGAPDAITLQALVGEAAGAPPLAAVVPGQPRARTAGRLRIMLMKRGDEGRQISNAAELLQRCNSWRYVPPGGGPAVGAECSEIELPDLEAGVAAAREADVFIGVHGANLANGWMLRPGASVIEILPYQFEDGRGATVFSTTNGKDATSQVLWWLAVLCDPAASTPGPLEAAGEGLPDWWPRDRNTRVPWAVLEAALRQAVAVGGDARQYQREYYATGRFRWHFGAAGVISQGERHCPAPPADR